MRYVMEALRGFWNGDPALFPEPKQFMLPTATRASILTPPMLAEGSVFGMSLRELIAPSQFKGVNWRDLYSEVTNYLHEGIDVKTCTSLFRDQVNLNARQRRWLLPHKRAWDLLACILWGWVCSKQVTIHLLSEDTFIVVDHQGDKYGVVGGKELLTGLTLARPKFEEYLTVQRKSLKPTSTLWVNPFYGRFKSRGSKEALWVLQALIWNTAQMGRVDGMLAKLIDPKAPITRESLVRELVIAQKAQQDPDQN